MTDSLLTSPARRRQAIQKWLDEEFTFTHFMSLASNSPDVSIRTMRDRIKFWDARLNRKLLGPKWRRHWDEATWWFAFLEKPDVNVHWHVLARFQDRAKLTTFARAAEQVWLEILPGGSVDFQVITGRHDRVTDYVSKRVGHDVEFAEFITPDEFRRT